jgi:hypothetical protein
MAEKHLVEYGGKRFPVPDGMTQEQVKAQMARFFPELAHPKIENKKDGEATVWVFSKQAGTKGAEAFDAWCIVELFGHVTLAGRVTEETIGGCAFVRLDVPEVDGQSPFTKLLGQGAIYSITPVSEEVARAAISRIRAKPVHVFYLPALDDARIEDDDDDDDDYS